MKLAEALTTIHQAREIAALYPVLLVCGFSPLHLQTFLAAHLQRRLTVAQKRVQVETGLYGSVADTLERLPDFRGEAAALFIEWSDLDARLGYRSLGGWGNDSLQGVLAAVEAMLARFAEALQTKPAWLRLVISLPTLALPPGFHTVSWQASAPELALENAVIDFARSIASLPSVLLLNRQQLAMASPLAERYDFRSDLNAGFPYSIRHADVLTEAVAGLMTPQPPKKGVISDLDDTMWRGIVGEEGAAGVHWDLAGHAQMHGLYQQMLQSLASQGVLIGIASKNNAETAEKALRRSDFVLQRDKIFPVEIHWEAKSMSVGRILKTWNIGAESVVFIDDSPMELEEVRAAHPGIECLLFPKSDYAATFSLFQKLRDLFGKPAVSEEDAFRLDSIRHSQQFLEGAAKPDLAEKFLASAEATVTFDWQPSQDDGRVLELLNKTNQFNLNGRRFTEAEWRLASSGPIALTAAVSYQDKFGPLGKIAVVNGQCNGTAVKIDAWVMSCRAFSRRIEFQILQQIFQKTGVSEVRLLYAETPKNSPTGDFLKSILGDRELGAETIVTRAEFAVRCPALYHRIENQYG